MVVTEKQKLRWGEKADNYNQITIKIKKKIGSQLARN